MYRRDPTLLIAIFITFMLSVDNILNIHAKEIAAYHEDRILREIIEKYSSKIRPVINAKDSVNVTLDITFNNIIDLNEKFQSLKSSIWVRQHWANPLFKWNTSHYGGLGSLIVDSRKLWLPDIALYNNINDETNTVHLDQRLTRVRIDSKGMTYWAVPYIFSTLCKIDVKNFPFDTQLCALNFGSWQYDGNEVNIINDKKLARIAKTRVPNGEWDVLKVEIKRTVHYYKCCPGSPYPELSFIIHMRRKPLFFLVNLVIPNILIALLAFFSFFIPVESGERISFVITVLLSMTVFMLLIAESIPPTSEAVPVIGIYYTFTIIEVFLALAATAVSLRINYSYLFGNGLSSRSKTLIFKYIGPWLGFDVAKMLCTKTKNKPRPNPSSITYGGCQCCRQATSPSPSNDMTDSDMMRNGNSQSSSTPYKYLEANIGNSDNPTESLMLHVMDNINDHYGKRNKDHHTVDHDDREITQTLTLKEREDQKIKESKLAATIIDYLFLWIFTSAYAIASTIILCIPLFNKQG
ncbi:neuronal acetylcholine receptor subunit alpha-10 [Exaiptasia diaphana]|uniref:Uncharacterized protein n=1 Tax=Exaiptasia diaphana TaxID=2652724 RepID=A0A913YBX0_EXADI|nr:neuronal acetylcholine receptor subunit alpha-10 [Exaiptasia diaphana]XP_020917355.1 neuronal acetylcholine receptor subunit alpha-10 [Exaiptasia diaphana]XP_028519666.1 neuronal acetylcholine receptor subunit alpha-10 [Exaiptasia diaphana]XP_028519667.1 neuronal acetylcholine receptor subunit alpha-10 [Exaiptasia diaphana]KXJ28250.1 Acetylcholine receptor subunit alpha-like 2 [Exaiptasia diaphana]